MTLEQWNHTIGVNLTASFLVTREYLCQLETHHVTENVAIVLIGYIMGHCSTRTRTPKLTRYSSEGETDRSTAGKFGEAYHAGAGVGMTGGLGDAEFGRDRLLGMPRPFHESVSPASLSGVSTDYACTKSAMMGGLLLSLKNEIVKTAPRGRVNCVAPGWVRTPMADKAMSDMNLLFQALATCAFADRTGPSAPNAADRPRVFALRGRADSTGLRCARSPSRSRSRAPSCS